MRKQSKSPAKRSKLEPLSVEEALSSPAVEGMFSFLSIRPEELLRSRTLAEVVAAALPSPNGPQDPPNEFEQAHEVGTNRSPGLEIKSRPGHPPDELQLEHIHESGLASNHDPGSTINSISGSVLNSIPGSSGNAIPGPELTNSPGLTSISDPGQESEYAYLNESGIQQPSEPTASTEAAPDPNTRPGLEFNPTPGSTQAPIARSRGQGQRTDQNSFAPVSLESYLPNPQGFFVPDRGESPHQRITPERLIGQDGEGENGPGAQFIPGPGLELHTDQNQRSLLVSEVRYTIRRAKLVQDGHTSNEQKLYEYLWTRGSPYDDISRRVSIGFRTLADRVRMARASAQKNLRGLVEKLAVEVIETFDVTSSKAPTYRVFNYTEILRRRESAGMIWYVRRTQAVRFVDPSGREVIRSVQNTPGLELISSPGIEIAPDPGQIIGPSPGRNLRGSPGLELGPPIREKEYEEIETKTSTSSDFPLPSILIEGLQRLALGFDEEAAIALWRNSRNRAPDCTADEILHFTAVKAATAKTGKIQNPVGFLLVAVPKCFEGQAFKTFREQDRNRRVRQQTREEDDQKNIQRLEDEMRLEQETYRQAEERLTTLPRNEYQALYNRKRSEFLTMVPKARHWTPQILDQSIRARLIREVQSELLTRRRHPESA